MTNESNVGLIEAFTKRPDGFLGDRETVEAALRLMLSAVLSIRDGVHTGKIPQSDLARLAMEALLKTARIFLGQDPNHVPVVGWNEPGGIDEHLAKELNLVDVTPEDRVVNALYLLACEICQLVKQEQLGMPEENTRWQMDAAIEQTARLFIGLPLDKPEPDA